MIGTSRYERSDERSNVRNGHRPRLLATQAGDIDLGIPELRRGSLFPSILDDRQRPGPGEDRDDSTRHTFALRPEEVATGNDPIEHDEHDGTVVDEVRDLQLTAVDRLLQPLAAELQVLGVDPGLPEELVMRQALPSAQLHSPAALRYEPHAAVELLRLRELLGLPSGVDDLG